VDSHYSSLLLPRILRVREITQLVPDWNVLVNLEPEELAGKLLFVLRKRTPYGGKYHLGNLMREFWMTTPPIKHPYESAKDHALIELAIAEAWAYLEAQGLLISSPEDGQHGWRVLSRRAQKFESEAEFARYSVARLLPKEVLHPSIAEKVWMAFMRSDFENAAFQAMKAVEVAVRGAAGYGNDRFGVPMMRDAFSPGKGPLTDVGAEGGEQVARMEVFAGAIGSYKNPSSHREIDLDDPVEALEIILFANHLLRIVDARAKKKSP
jgi:uncharacterized protein (TIGR02391 family)